MGNTNLLSNLYLFKDLSSGEMKVIEAAAEKMKYGPGDEVFSHSDRAKALYVVQSGSVKIYQTADNGEVVEIARLGAGSHFGEMSFLDGESRSASATALEPSEIIVIDYDKLSEIMIDHPGISIHFYRQFAIFLCGRLRVTTKDLNFSRSKILSHF
jgi:CRP/FNR family transcriptional regulator, cyclic AMP receptor protein